jgi:hypothetical protein
LFEHYSQGGGKPTRGNFAALENQGLRLLAGVLASLTISQLGDAKPDMEAPKVGHVRFCRGRKMKNNFVHHQ